LNAEDVTEASVADALPIPAVVRHPRSWRRCAVALVPSCQRVCHLYFARRVTFLSCADSFDGRRPKPRAKFWKINVSCGTAVRARFVTDRHEPGGFEPVCGAVIRPADGSV